MLCSFSCDEMTFKCLQITTYLSTGIEYVCVYNLPCLIRQVQTSPRLPLNKQHFFKLQMKSYEFNIKWFKRFKKSVKLENVIQLALSPLLLLLLFICFILPLVSSIISVDIFLHVFQFQSAFICWSELNS